MRTRKIKAFSCPEYISRALRSLTPPENLTVSQWAEKYRMLDARSSAIPGPWRNRKTPYLVEIMDAILDPEIETVIFVKPTQVGGTEAEMNMIGYVVCQDPSPTLVVYPTEQLAESISQNRLVPMIKASPAMKPRYKEYQSQKLELQFDGMYLTLIGSNSPSNLASRPIKYLMLDEVDKYPGSSKKEADPIALAKERTKTYASRKIYMTSTPTVREGHIWDALENADVLKHYFVPCPHCGEYIELLFSQIRWPEAKEGLTLAERAEHASYVCQECGCMINDWDKDAMLQAGRWQVVRNDTGGKKTAAYWMNTLYSPFVRFSEIALEFMRSKDDPEKFQNFKNSWLAEPWEDTATHTSEDLVLERQTDVPEFIVPDWARMLTGGVDVQKDCMYYTIRAWGDYITSQNIAHGQVRGWADIERVMNQTYRNADGDTFVVMLCLVDSGYNTDETYEFCLANAEWATPVKGSPTQMETHYRISTVNKAGRASEGIQIVIANSDKYKDMIASRMHKPNGTGSWMVYSGCDSRYAAMVTAEHKVNVRSNGKTVQRWVPKASHIDNHYLDCEVYALAAADIMGVRSWYGQEDQEAEEKPEKQEDQETEENWIQKNEGWI